MQRELSFYRSSADPKKTVSMESSDYCIMFTLQAKDKNVTSHCKYLKKVKVFVFDRNTKWRKKGGGHGRNSGGRGGRAVQADCNQGSQIKGKPVPKSSK